jgi:hypothetical protein
MRRYPVRFSPPFMDQYTYVVRQYLHSMQDYDDIYDWRCYLILVELLIKLQVSRGITLLPNTIRVNIDDSASTRD